MRTTPAYSKIAFIMLTSETDKLRIIEAVKTGIQSFMFKPVQKTVLAQKLKDIALKQG
jgi:PleD family two-component response regulator